MALLSERCDGYLILRPLGLWDESVQREMEAQVLGQRAIGVDSFVIDLRGTDHIRFKIIPALLDLAGQIARCGGDLVMASPSPYLLEVLAAGDVPRRIPVFPSEASAALGISHASAAVFECLRDGEREIEAAAGQAAAAHPGR